MVLTIRFFAKGYSQVWVRTWTFVALDLIKSNIIVLKLYDGTYQSQVLYGFLIIII